MSGQRKYVSKAWLDDDGLWPSDEKVTTTVFETDDDPVFTGLYDADGTKIFRVRQRAPLGFQGRKK